MRIKGSNKADVLAGSFGIDMIEGGRGNDSLDGGAGNDTLVVRSGGGNDVVSDFDAASGDRVMFDFGTYSDIMVFGRLSDGLSWSNFDGSARFSVAAADVNGDGLADTVLRANNDSITLLGVAPDALWGNCLFGG